MHYAPLEIEFTSHFAFQVGQVVVDVLKTNLRELPAAVGAASVASDPTVARTCFGSSPSDAPDGAGNPPAGGL